MMYVNADYLKAKMLLAGLSSSELAEKCGCSTFVISAICRNAYLPSTALARKIAFHLKLNEEDIIKIFFSELEKLSLEELLEVKTGNRK